MSETMENQANSPRKKIVGYKTKPVLIEVFALIYLLNPIGNLLTQIFFNLKNSPYQNWQFLVHCITDGNIIVIINVILWISAIPLAYGLYKVRLWAWYYFLIHSVSMVIISLFDGAGAIHPSIATLINILFLIPIGYFISKEIRVPYFNPSVRWWEQSVRFHHEVTINIAERVFQTYDLSDTGAFIMSDDDMGYESKELLPMTLTINGTVINCFAEIIWHKVASDDKHPAGYGIKFSKLSFSDRQEIKKYIKSLQNIGKQVSR